MDTKFELGELVKLVGVTRGISSQGGGVVLYSVEIEGTPPFLGREVLINERAIRKADEKDLEFHTGRGIRKIPPTQEMLDERMA